MPDWMRIALAEAVVRRENGKEVWPYPWVGAVLVHGGSMVVRAHNEAPGSGKPHAEHALIFQAKNNSVDISECVLYTNMEPCSNDLALQGACTSLIIESGIKEVHVAMRDPYKPVRGEGIRVLEEAGVKVVFGEHEELARWQNEQYIHRFCPGCGEVLQDR